VNNLGNILWSIPLPESFTLTIIVLLLLLLLILSFSILTSIVPSAVNSTALLKRFEITCDILPLSAFIKISRSGLYDRFIFLFLRKSL
jgi:hypothetical protein